MLYIYRTGFTLSGEVNDFEKAKAYLKDDDMLWYLDEDSTKSKLKSIVWELTDKQSGYVEVIAKERLNKEDLDYLKEYISGQNSDGMGEGFASQDFAIIYNDDDTITLDDVTDTNYDETDYQEYTSFNWRYDNYDLVLIDEYEA